MLVRGTVITSVVRIASAVAFALVTLIGVRPVGADTTPWYDEPLTQATASQFTSMAEISCPTSVFCAAGGSYTITHGRLAFVTTFNGTSWTSHIVGAPLDTTNAVVTAVSCTTASFCLAGGHYQSSSGTTLGFVSQWNGSQWSDQTLPALTPAPTSDTVDTISCVEGPFCVVGGSYLAQGARSTLPFVSVFDGTQWRGHTFDLNAAPVSSNGQLVAGGITAVSCVSRLFCVAGGGYGDGTNYGGGPASEPMVATWDGANWSATEIAANVNAGHSGTVTALSCGTTTFCMAAGVDAQQSGSRGIFLSRFDGAQWLSSDGRTPEAMTQSSTDPSLAAVSCTGTAFCVVVGSYRHAEGTGTRQTSYAEMVHGDGSFDLPLESSLPSTGSADVTSVSCTSSVFCVAGGSDTPVDQSFSSIPSSTFAFVSVWNGGQWHDLPVATSLNAASAGVDAVSCTATYSCHAVGHYVDQGNNEQDFDSVNGPLAQSPLAITTATKGVVGRQLFLTTSGGSGTVAPTFQVLGNHCILHGALLTASQSTKCEVSARNQANGPYAAVVAPPVTFSFTLQVQQTLRVVAPSVGRVARPLPIVVTGGSGAGTVRLNVTGAGCYFRGRFVVAQKPTLCTVRASKEASGPFAPASSTPLTISFQ